MDVTFDFLGDFNTFSVFNFESGLTFRADVVFFTKNTVIDVTDNWLNSTFSVFNNKSFFTGVTDIIDQTFFTVIDITRNGDFNTGTGFNFETFSTSGTDVIFISTFHTVHDITIWDDNFSTTFSIINNLESINTSFTDIIIGTSSTVFDITGRTFVFSDIENQISFTSFTSVSEETVFTVINLTFKTFSCSNVGEIKDFWALSIVNTSSSDITGVTEFSWTFET